MLKNIDIDFMDIILDNDEEIEPDGSTDEETTAPNSDEILSPEAIELNNTKETDAVVPITPIIFYLSGTDRGMCTDQNSAPDGEDYEVKEPLIGFDTGPSHTFDDYDDDGDYEEDEEDRLGKGIRRYQQSKRKRPRQQLHQRRSNPRKQ